MPYDNESRPFATRVSAPSERSSEPRDAITDRAVDWVDRHALFDELEGRGLTPGQIATMWPSLSRFVAKFLIGRPGLLPVQPEDLLAEWREVTHG